MQTRRKTLKKNCAFCALDYIIHNVPWEQLSPPDFWCIFKITIKMASSGHFPQFSTFLILPSIPFYFSSEAGKLRWVWGRRRFFPRAKKVSWMGPTHEKKRRRKEVKRGKKGKNKRLLVFSHKKSLDRKVEQWGKCLYLCYRQIDIFVSKS